MKDNKKHRSFILYLKANAIRDEKMRLDLTSSLGGHVASLVLTGNDLKYVLVPQKRYFEGSSRAESLRPVLSMPLDPRWLYDIFFDQPIRSPGWSCSSENTLVKDCQNPDLGLKVSWSERMGAKRTVVVDHEMGRLQMNFQNWKPDLDRRANLFALETPSGFQKIK